jgi:hypothetical protein
MAVQLVHDFLALTRAPGGVIERTASGGITKKAQVFLEKAVRPSYFQHPDVFCELWGW